MFDKFKQLKNLKKIQDELGQERAEVEKQGVRVVINGKMEVEEVALNKDLLLEDQAKLVKECINEAMDKMKFIMAQKMQQMPGMDL